MKEYYENMFDEILQMIKDNLELLYKYNEDALINIKEYCNKNNNKEYEPLDYIKLIYYTEEALAELINAPDLYDLRLLE